MSCSNAWCVNANDARTVSSERRTRSPSTKVRAVSTVSMEAVSNVAIMSKVMIVNGTCLSVCMYFPIFVGLVTRGTVRAAVPRVVTSMVSIIRVNAWDRPRLIILNRQHRVHNVSNLNGATPI